MPDTNEITPAEAAAEAAFQITALRRAHRALLRDGVIRLDMLADLESARRDYIAVSGRDPLGWYMIDGDRVHWSSYGETFHPQVVLKRLITRLGDEVVSFEWDHKTNILRLKFRPDADA